MHPVNDFFQPFQAAIGLASFPSGMKINYQTLEMCLSCVICINVCQSYFITVR